MSFVIVSLVGDEATQAADTFMQWLAVQRPPCCYVAARCPDREEVRKCAATHAIVSGHNGGGSLRAEPAGEPWLDAPGLGKTFTGARLYAFACYTLSGERGVDDIQAIGYAAVESGVSAFAGHAGWIDASWGERLEEPTLTEVRKAVAEVVWRFLGGENDATKLRLLAEETFSALEVIDLELGPDGSGGLWVTVPYAMHIAMQGFRIVTPSQHVRE